MFSNEDPEEQFELLEQIGEGAYASVFKGRHKDGQIVAIKIVPSTGEIQSLIKEIQILKECKSQYIVQYFGSFYKSGNLWLIMEYCAAGSIIDLMRITDRNLTEQEIQAILYQVLVGIDYLHQNKKIHRDIKGGNILLDASGQVKLADFGVSAQLTFTNADKGTVIGTPFWMSPEVISKNRYNNLTDIWSLGVTAIELAEGTPPYSHIHPVRAMFAIKNNPPQGLTNPDKWSPEFNAFVKSCLKVQVSERPTAQQLLQTQFVKLGQLESKRLRTMVQQSQDQIDHYRLNKQAPSDKQIVTIVSEAQSDHNSVGTVVECGTLIINDNEDVKQENPELDFVTYAKQQKKIDELVDDHINEEAQMQNLSVEESKKFLQFLQSQMEEELQLVKQKYLPKIELLMNKIEKETKPKPKEKEKEKEREQLVKQKSPQRIEVNVPFNFQVNTEMLQKLSSLQNKKMPQIIVQTVSSPKSQLRRRLHLNLYPNKIQMECIDEHIQYLCDRITSVPATQPKESIVNSIQAREHYRNVFNEKFNEFKFKKDVKKSHFEQLLKDRDFLITYMQLYALDGSHYIFNNAMQHFIDSIEYREVFEFILQELPMCDCKFNSEWSVETVGRLLDKVIEESDILNNVEIMLLILQRTTFNLELVLKLITTRIQLSDKIKIVGKIKDMNPLVYFIIQLMDIFIVDIEQVVQQYNNIMAAFRHFFRDIIREYAQQTKVSMISDFIVALTCQLPTLVDQQKQSAYLITLIVNEIANTVSYLQYQKKLLSQTKLKLVELVINLSQHSCLLRINFYFTVYILKQNSKEGTCQLCLYENQPLVEMVEVEYNKKLIETCRECYYTKLPTQFPDESCYQEQLYLPAIAYGSAVKSKQNWSKLAFEYYMLSSISPNRKSNLSVAQLNKVSKTLEQYITDYGHLEDVHMYLDYYGQMSFYLLQLFPTYKVIELILLAFLDDSSIQVRGRVLEYLVDHFIRVKESLQSNAFGQHWCFSIFETAKIQSKIFQRAQDVSKQIRILAVRQVLHLWEKTQIPCLDLLIKRLSDIESSVRLKTLKSCFDKAELFKQLAVQEQIQFFEEVSKRLQEKGEISEWAAKLICLLLVQNVQDRDREITDRLLELATTDNNLKIDFDRLQSLIEKLSNSEDIINKNGVLHCAIIRLIQHSKNHDELQHVQNVLKLINILIIDRNAQLQQVVIRQIDNIIAITAHYLEIHDTNNLISVNILNDLFRLLIFSMEEFTHPSYDKLQFQLTTKISNQLDLLTIFIENILFKLHPRTPYIRSLFQLSVLLDLKYTKNYQNIQTKLETIIKLIFLKSDSPISLQYSLIGFGQIFQYIEYFIGKLNVDVKEFFTETVHQLYMYLLELSQVKSASEEIVYALQKIWEKVPQLMFESVDFIRDNLEGNKFEDPVVIAIYQIFYQTVTDANTQAQNQQYDQLDRSQIAFIIKDIFNITFSKHIMHPNSQIRMIVLKLIECLYDNHLSLALHFGDHLLASLIYDPILSEPIIQKCIETRPDHILLQFQNGITLQIKHHKICKPCFTGLDLLLRNVNKQDLICNSKYFDVCSTKLSEYILYLDEQYLYSKMDINNYEKSLNYILTQLVNLPYLTAMEIRTIVKSCLNRITDYFDKAEQVQHQLTLNNNNQQIIRVLLIRLFYAYQFIVDPDIIFGSNVRSLSQIEFIKKNPKKKTGAIQVFQMNPQGVDQFNQYINTIHNKITIPTDLSDSENQPDELQQKDNQELDMAIRIYERPLGDINAMLKELELVNMLEKLSKTKQKQQNEIVEEVVVHTGRSKSKSKNKSNNKRKPRKISK